MLLSVPYDLFTAVMQK